MKGFTLVETLIAITIVLLAVMGPFELVKSSLLASHTARDQMIASALAEEGFEYVRVKRDSNYLYTLANPNNPREWLYGMRSYPDCFTYNCTVYPDVVSEFGFILNPCVTTCAPLRISATTGVYTQYPGRDDVVTRFTRHVRLEPVDGASDKVVKVTSTVTYISNHTPFTVTVTDYLYNWL